MGLEGVSKQYRQLAGLDSPTDTKKVKSKAKAAPGPEVEPEAVAEIVDEDGAPLEEPEPEEG